VADRFPDNYTLRYNLACYACQLGDLKQAWQWLSKAIDLAGKTDLRQQALDDPDLEPLWTRISEISNSCKNCSASFADKVETA
jgi:hypothetical protein